MLFKLLKNIEVTKAAGIDKISGKFLKDRAQVLAKPISELCNLSITLGSFLSVCKIAKVKPLFKKGPIKNQSIKLLTNISNAYIILSLKELLLIKQKNSKS